MRITKLVIGILMIVFAVWLFFQAIAEGFIGISGDRYIFGGILEILISLLFIAAGIVYICTQKASQLGGDIACLVLMIIAGILGLVGGLYNALILTGVIALIIGFGFFIWHLSVRN